MEQVDKYAKNLLLNAVICLCYGLMLLFLPDTENSFYMEQELNEQARLFLRFIGIFQILIAFLSYQISQKGTESLKKIASDSIMYMYGLMYAIMYYHKEMYLDGAVQQMMVLLFVIVLAQSNVTATSYGWTFVGTIFTVYKIYYAGSESMFVLGETLIILLITLII